MLWGLSKFALDPVVVIFFKKCQKNYKWWSDPVLRKFSLDPTLRKFALDPVVVIFFKKC